MFKYSLLFACMLFFLMSCQPENEITSKESASEALFEVMNDYYYWYSTIPSNIDYRNYDDPTDLLHAMRNSIDKWSYVADKQEFDHYFNDGSYIGTGVGFKYDSNNLLRVTLVYENSPLTADGVSRGWILTKINDITISPEINVNSLFNDQLGTFNKLEFLDLENNVFVNTYPVSEIEINTVIHKEIIEESGKKIGYLVYSSFVEPSIEELDEAFSEFKTAGITDLVLDLRYNGGGRVSVASHLANLIGGKIAENQIFVTYIHNDKHRDLDSFYQINSTVLSLDISKLYCITTSSTASASELIINGLEPFMDVILIGSTTHGKPVGMYGFDYGLYTFVPVCFEGVNANNMGGYYNGIDVDFNVSDDLSRPWGDSEEDCFQMAIALILGKKMPEQKFNEQKPIPLNGLKAEIGAF